MQKDIQKILTEFVAVGASDCYLTVDSPPAFRLAHGIEVQNFDKLTQADIEAILQVLLTEEAINEFNANFEYNTAIMVGGARFRVNVFRQRNQTGLVLRRILTEIPSIEQLLLPKTYGDLILERRGLILLVGGAGSGKSTSLAAMLGHRNTHGSGHIVTIEDPVEFLHEHNKCIITQRDVGVDTNSFKIALKNTLRQSPDVIMIGEIRDRETMEHAIVFSETGHLCLATLHANNANQAIERIINFFPEEKHTQILLNLSLNLKAVLSQRLMENTQGKQSLATEIMLNNGAIRELIAEGRIKELREHIEKGHDMGMHSFEQSLLRLYMEGTISEEIALAESNNSATLQLRIKQYKMSKGIEIGEAQSKMQFADPAYNKTQF